MDNHEYACVLYPTFLMLTLYLPNIFGEVWICICITWYTTVPHWNGKGSKYIMEVNDVNDMVPDGLAIQGARASMIITLTFFSQNIPVFAPKMLISSNP